MATQAQTAAIPTLQRYIANLSAVPAAQRTAAQSASLTLYQDRLRSWTATASGGGTPTPVVATAPTAAVPPGWLGSYTPAGVPESIQSAVNSAMAAQAQAQAAAGGGARGYNLDWAAQLRNVIANGSFLPNATGPGLSILPGTPRGIASPADIDRWQGILSELVSQYGFSPAELSAADARLAANLAAGVSLDPGSASATMMELGQAIPSRPLAPYERDAALALGLPTGGNASSQLGGTFTTSPTPQGGGTPTSTALLQTGVAGGVPITAGGSDAGSPAVGSAFPFLDGGSGGAGGPLDLLVIGAAALGLVYLARTKRSRRRSASKE